MASAVTTSCCTSTAWSAKSVASSPLTAGQVSTALVTLVQPGDQDPERRRDPQTAAGLRPSDRLRILRALEICRTATLGGHTDACDACGHTRISYNSCRNRHCPKCQALARAEWLEAR